jgi:hypothetical protein
MFQRCTGNKLLIKCVKCLLYSPGHNSKCNQIHVPVFKVNSHFDSDKMLAGNDTYDWIYHIYYFSVLTASHNGIISPPD